jgi:hypothetical protein
MIIKQERRVNNFIFRLLVHLFLSDKTMDTVDFEILHGGPPQKLIDPPIYSRASDSGAAARQSARGNSARSGNLTKP